MDKKKHITFEIIHLTSNLKTLEDHEAELLIVLDIPNFKLQ